MWSSVELKCEKLKFKLVHTYFCTRLPVSVAYGTCVLGVNTIQSLANAKMYNHPSDIKIKSSALNLQLQQNTEIIMF